MTLLWTLIGCCMLLIVNGDQEAGQDPFTAFGSTAEVADDTFDLLGDSADYVEYQREERSQSGFTAFNSAYQPQANIYQPYQPAALAYQPAAPAYQQAAPVYQPAAPAYQPAEPAYQTAAPVYQPEAPIYQPEIPADQLALPAQSVVPAEAQEDIPISTTPAPTFEDLYGFDVAEKTREDTKGMTQFILTIAQNEDTLPLVNELVNTNPCVSDLEGLIALIEHYGKIVEDNGPELENMFLTFQSLRGERNITILMQESSDLLLKLDDLNTKLDLPSLVLKCGGSSEDGISAMRDMALVFYKMSLIKDIPLLTFNKDVKQRLYRTALTVEAITNMLNHLREDIAKRDCFTSKDFLGDFIKLSAETIYGMAEVLGALGFLPAAKEARQYAAFTESIVATLDKFEGFKFPNGCGPGGLRRAAKSFSGMADIISDIGIEALAIELGITIRLDLLP